MLASEGEGAGWVAWERNHRAIVVSRVTEGGDVYEVAALERPSTPLGVLTALVSFELEPKGRARLRYGDAVVELSPGGAWPDGPLSRARVASSTPLRAALALVLGLTALFGALALRQQRWLVAARVGPVVSGLVREEDRARPVLVALDGAAHALDLRGARVFGEALCPDWHVLGEGVTAGEGAYRAQAELRVTRVYAGITPEALHEKRRDRHWLFANVALMAAAVLLFAAAFG